MSAESVRIINAAITRQNGNIISSVDGGSKEDILFDANYEQIVRDELIGPSWKFARKVELLVADPTAPVDTDWTYAMAVPATLLHLRTVIKDGKPIRYQLDSDANGVPFILTNDNTDVYAIFTFRAAEDVWPYDFKEGITRRLEAIMVSSDERGALVSKERNDAADKSFAKCRRAHAQESPPIDPHTYPLLSARRIGNAPGRM